jgi:hypothetical protein
MKKKKPQSTNTCVAVTPEVRDRLRLQARMNGMRISGLVDLLSRISLETKIQPKQESNNG